MTALSKRKTRLSFATSATVNTHGTRVVKAGPDSPAHVKHVRVDRPIIAEVFPEYVALRLAGQRHRLEVSWRGIHDFAARVAADKLRAERRARRKQGRP